MARRSRVFPVQECNHYLFALSVELSCRLFMDAGEFADNAATKTVFHLLSLHVNPDKRHQSFKSNILSIRVSALS